MTQQTKQGGFTLIELTLAMTFVSVLLLTIAMTVIQIGTIYNRGMTLKEVNQAARNISDDIRRTAGSVGDFDLDIGGNKNYVVVKSGNGVEVGGRLCLGSYSYIWNTAAGIELIMKGDLSVKERIAFNSQADANKSKVIESDLVRLKKVPDVGRRYCEKVSPTSQVPRDINILDTDAPLAIELVRAGDRAIAVQKFIIVNSTLDPASGQGLYRVAYTLGTGDTSAMNADRTACLPPSDPNSNLEYCNIQRFVVALRTGSGVN